MPTETKTAVTELGWIAVLGRKDFPTDGVVDYCTFLGQALSRRGLELKQVHVNWDKLGWIGAFRQLSRESVSWRANRILLQYTALSWSRHGFPFATLFALWILRRNGARVAVMFHEPLRQTAIPTLVNRIRGNCQDWVIRKLYEGADRAIFADELKSIPWLPNEHGNPVFIPIGANFPELQPVPEPGPSANGETKSIAVFCLTDSLDRRKELADISHAVRFAASRGARIRVVFLGRGTKEAQEDIDTAFAGIPAEIENLGLLPAAEVSRHLASSTAMLCVRGSLFPRRGSAIAGIACGLPIIGYVGPNTCFPITEAGLELVPEGDRDALAKALDRVLSDERVRQDLRLRSLRASSDYFSWNKIAERYATELTVREYSYRVLLVLSHPVQYMSPILRDMSKHPKLDILAAYCSLPGTKPEMDPEFGVEIAWDIPLFEGYPWVRVPNRSFRPGLGRFFGLVNPGLWKIVRSGKFDVVMIFTGYRYATFWITAMIARVKRLPILFGTDAHDMEPRVGGSWKKHIKKWLWPRLFRFADVVIVPSSGGVNLMHSLGIPPERVVLTPYTVDNKWWIEQATLVDRSAVRAGWGIPDDAPVVLFCAKLQPWKRPLDLLRAFAKANVKGSYLVLVGEGPLRAALEVEVQALGIAERVRFLGFVNQSGLPPVYRASDLFVLPSEYEAFGVVVNEAMLCGCAVIVSDKVGARFDLVHDRETGFVFPMGNIEALAALLGDILPDREKLQHMGNLARQSMAEWSPEKNIESMIRAIEAALRLSSRQGGMRQ